MRNPPLLSVNGPKAPEALDIHIILSYYVYRSEVIQVSRTNVVLDDTLVTDCQKATGLKTRRALIDHALQELLRHERQKKVLELKGTVQWEGNLAIWRKGRG
jgi:Arc/MetJ family transcription regulator